MNKKVNVISHLAAISTAFCLVSCSPNKIQPLDQGQNNIEATGIGYQLKKIGPFSIRRGATQTIQLKVDRGSYDGPIKIQLKPEENITLGAKEVTIPSGQDSINVDATVNANAKSEKYVVYMNFADRRSISKINSFIINVPIGTLQLGTSQDDFISSITTDSIDNIYATGWKNTNSPLSSADDSVVLTAGNKAFITRHSPTGQLTAEIDFSAPKPIKNWLLLPQKISIMNSDIYVAGTVLNQNNTDPNNNNADLFWARFDINGDLQQFSRLETKDINEYYGLNSLSIGSDGSVFLTAGQIMGFPLEPNENHMVLAKFDSAGNLKTLKTRSHKNGDEGMELSMTFSGSFLLSLNPQKDTLFYGENWAFESFYQAGYVAEFDNETLDFKGEGFPLMPCEAKWGCQTSLDNFVIDDQNNIYMVGRHFDQEPFYGVVAKFNYDKNTGMYTENWIKYFEFPEDLDWDNLNQIKPDLTLAKTGQLITSSDWINDKTTTKQRTIWSFDTSNGNQLWNKTITANLNSSPANYNLYGGLATNSQGDVLVALNTTDTFAPFKNTGKIDAFIISFDKNGNVKN